MHDDLLILTEAGEQIGYGHLTRCSAIWKYCQQNGISCNLLLDWQGSAANPTQFGNVQWRNVKLANEWPVTSVLVDSYKTPLPYFAELKRDFSKVFVLDDYCRYADFGVDMIINPNTFGDNMPYTAPCAGGKDFVILRDAFRDSASKYTVGNEITNIMVTVGGADPHKLLPKLAAAFTDTRYKLTFVCGNDEYASELSAIYSATGYTFVGYADEYKMQQLMLAADLAISACGQTLHELVYTGVPVIGICTGDDQILNMTWYVNAGILPGKIFWDDPELVIRIRQHISDYDVNTRLDNSIRSRDLLSGNGVANIINLVAAA